MTGGAASRIAATLLLVGSMSAGCGYRGHSGDSVPNFPAAPAPVMNLDPCPTAVTTRGPHLPAVALSCLGPGAKLALSQLPRRPYVINLWASWCDPCQREARRLQAAAALGTIAFLGIDSADERNSALDFLNHFNIRYPQLEDPHSTALHALHYPGLPVTLAINANGDVVYRRVGEISAAQLAEAVRAADAETGAVTTSPS